MSREFSVTIRSALMVALLTLFAALAGLRPALAAETVRLVVLGDSLVAGYGLAPGESYPEQLQAALADEGMIAEITNAGVSGDTTAGGLARLDWAVDEETDAVIVELGANDALRGIEPLVTRDNLNDIITRLKERNIDVLIAGMRAPPNLGVEFGRAFNAIYPDLAEQHGVTLYPFFLDGVAANTNLNQADGMHPTAEGIAEIVRRSLPKVMEFIRQVAED